MMILGLQSGFDFGQRKQRFWVEKMVILGKFAIVASSFSSSSSPLIIYMNLYTGWMILDLNLERV